MTFLNNFSDHLTNIINDHKNLIILGDKDVQYEDNEDLDKQAFDDLLNTFGLKQWVNCTAIEAGYTLESIIMQINGDLDVSEAEQGWKYLTIG